MSEPTTIDELVRHAVDERPDEGALADAPNRTTLDGGLPQRLTWTEVDARIDGAAAELQAAGVVLVSDQWLAEHDRSARSVIGGWGHTTVGLPIDQKFERSRDSDYVMPHVRRAITDAFDRAGIGGADQLDAIETHDCMTPSEYMAIDHFGITAPGESWKAIEEGRLERNGDMPVNPSGGLIGGGHPVGATGARMLVDATKQVSGTAGNYQFDGAERVATLNIGGSTATTACFVVEAANR